MRFFQFAVTDTAIASSSKSPPQKALLMPPVQNRSRSSREISRIPPSAVDRKVASREPDNSGSAAIWASVGLISEGERQSNLSSTRSASGLARPSFLKSSSDVFAQIEMQILPLFID